MADLTSCKFVQDATGNGSRLFAVERQLTQVRFGKLWFAVNPGHAGVQG